MRATPLAGVIIVRDVLTNKMHTIKNIISQPNIFVQYHHSSFIKLMLLP